MADTADNLDAVSIHAPARGATLSCGNLHHCFDVSIHAPARGATTYWAAASADALFQSTRPHGARRIPLGCLPHLPKSLFQSTRPHGARPLALHQPARCAVFQSTRPHGARLHARSPHRHARRVSIHAPARGATTPAAVLCKSGSGFNPRARTGRDVNGQMFSAETWHVSIHAPARGATHPLGSATPDCTSFNPRARTGRDMPWRCTSQHGVPCFNPRARTGRDPVSSPSKPQENVSIHAPARGATASLAASSPYSLPFQSTRPHGARQVSSTLRDLPCLFQSTRPHGARPVEETLQIREGKFQSTRPHGARHEVTMTHNLLPEVSIHAPARGATAAR